MSVRPGCGGSVADPNAGFPLVGQKVTEKLDPEPPTGASSSGDPGPPQVLARVGRAPLRCPIAAVHVCFSL